MTARAAAAAPVTTYATALRTQAAALLALADALDAAGIAPPTPPTPRYADRDVNPYGSARAFLDAARRGDFETFRRARKVSALWVDVQAAIERSKRAPRARKPDPADDDRALLDGAGLRPKGRAR